MKQSFICFHLAPLHCSGQWRRRAGIPAGEESLQTTPAPVRWRRLPQGVRLNTLSPGCSTTKTHAEQRHFHHVSHSSCLTGTAKSSLIPPLCAGAHTGRWQQLRAWLPGPVDVLSGYSTNRSPSHHGHSSQNSGAMGRTEFALMPRSPQRKAGGLAKVSVETQQDKPHAGCGSHSPQRARAWCSPSLIPQWLHRPPGSKHTATVTF